ncbi:hypothetical protein [Methanobrevibacter sp.]|uniref:hypothetical protein n=1 Tax=Methanobrevibacter sp. TaxID=66852 RepID=UPI00388FA806
MEFLHELIEMLNSGKFEDIILKIEDFLHENPQYKTIDYYHFANPLEELLFDKYMGDIESAKVLGHDEVLDEIYVIYSIAHKVLGNADEEERYLKIANQINPVSAQIQMRLCELYQSRHEEEKLKDLSCDIFRYAYDVEILTSNYFKLADYIYHTNQNMELYDHLFNLFMFLKSGDELKPVSEDIQYLKSHNIQVGANPEILMMLMYLIEVHTQQGMLGSAEYFKGIFNELAEFTRYLNTL